MVWIKQWGPLLSQGEGIDVPSEPLEELVFGPMESSLLGAMTKGDHIGEFLTIWFSLPSSSCISLL